MQHIKGRFLESRSVEREKLSWGQLGWLSRPSTTGATAISTVEVEMGSGGGHSFHKHPRQEELIYVVEGQIEQWLETERKTLGPGDVIFIPANVVHASFNVSKAKAKVLAILSPCVGPDGYECVDVFTEEPWKSLKA